MRRPSRLTIFQGLWCKSQERVYAQRVVAKNHDGHEWLHEIVKRGGKPGACIWLARANSRYAAGDGIYVMPDKKRNRMMRLMSAIGRRFGVQQI